MEENLRKYSRTNRYVEHFSYFFERNITENLQEGEKKMKEAQDEEERKEAEQKKTDEEDEEEEDESETKPIEESSDEVRVEPKFTSSVEGARATLVD